VRTRAAAIRPPSAPERGRAFLILPFRNLSRSAAQEWLVEGSPTLLSDALSRWREIRVVPDDRLYPALRRHGLVPGSVFDQPAVRRVADETGGWTAVTGEVLATGGRIRISARAYDVISGQVVVRATAEAAVADDIRPAYERIATQLLGTTGLSLDSADPDVATTQSLEAYRAYLRGLTHLHRSEYRQARTAFAEAIRLDSAFAQPYAKLATASLFLSPEAALDPRNPLYQYAERATALSARLPARERSLVRAGNAMLQGRLADARGMLESMVAQDSSDVESLEALGLLEYFDLVLVTQNGVERTRGSLNAALRHFKRVLALEPARQSEYLTLAQIYGQTGGDLPGLFPAYRREAASLAVMMGGTMPARVFAPVLRDSIVMLPVSKLVTVPAETVAAARLRGRNAMRAWVERWLAAAPHSAEAHRMFSRLAELDGDFPNALRELDTAEAEGIETAWEAVPARRMVLYAKVGRRSDALRLADSLFAAGAFDSVLAFPSPRLETPVWAFNLYALVSRPDRADAIVTKFAARLSADVGVPAPLAEASATAILSGATLPPYFLVEVPRGLRLEVADSVAGDVAGLPVASMLRRAAPQLLRLALASADGPPRARLARRTMDAAFAVAGPDSAATDLARRLARVAVEGDSSLAPRAAAAPWSRPPR
jgi:TolB-like protein/alkylhydroperoxidase/carboxymuconolactone decarboxylase family protein YurZ